jgi:hypothetical protein
MDSGEELMIHHSMEEETYTAADEAPPNVEGWRLKIWGKKVEVKAEDAGS